MRAETKTEEQQDCNEAEDSEGDEMVDIERIEDKEEDPATTAQAKVKLGFEACLLILQY